MAQAPQGFTYQGVATDNNGFELQNQTISIQASILSSSATGTTVWQETHNTTTDTFGLFNVVIGEGTSTNNGSSATFQEIDWGAAAHFMKVEIDVNGGSNYVHVGTSQMMSVPYALYAENVHNLNMDSILGAVYDSINTSFSSGAMSVSVFGDTLTMNGQSIIVPGISFSNAAPSFGTVTDIDGNTYQTVIHGNIEIMAENLKTESFNNGDPIPEICYCGTNINSMCSTPGWTFYDCQYSNLSYGRLYNGYTVADTRNACPTGWSIASGNDWIQLLDLFVTNYHPASGYVNVDAILASSSNESGLSILLGGSQGPGGSGWANGQGGFEYFYYGQGEFDISTTATSLPQNGINPNGNTPSGYNYRYIRCVKD